MAIQRAKKLFCFAEDLQLTTNLHRKNGGQSARNMHIHNSARTFAHTHPYKMSLWLGVGYACIALETPTSKSSSACEMRTPHVQVCI